VVAGSFDKCVHLVDSATGRAVAIVKTDGKIYSTALIIGDMAYIGSQDKKLYVIDLIDGSVVKSFPLGGRIFAPPVLLDGIIHVGTTGGRLFGIDPVSLEMCETLQLPDRIVNPPLLVRDGSVIVVPVFGNRLFAFGMERVADRAADARSFPDTAARRQARPLSAALIDGARPEGTYFRIDEPVGVPVFRPFPTIPSRRMLGAATLLTIHAHGYRDLTQVEIDGRVLPALIANQARVFLYGLQPIGMVTWAHLSPEAEARLVREGGLPKPGEWSKGERIWIIDVIAPFGGSQAMLDKVRRETLRGRTVHMLRPRAGGGFDTVTLPP
jgi:cytolysin-activating lysine-acyltransferase